MTDEWRAEIAKAQKQPTRIVRGMGFDRFRHDSDTPCRDCGVQRGQLHVAICCVERCPCCFAQALTCFCRENGDS
jgi:hypothetical protein